MLLLTKFSFPRQPNALVMRERLLQALDTAFVCPLTLLSASAGWGKTTLLSSWASRHSRQVAWVSLDERDNDPLCFWISVITALRRSGTCPPTPWSNGFGDAAIGAATRPDQYPDRAHQ